MRTAIDLHMHSCYSDDGQYTPRELIAMCHASGIQICALADHNTIKGVEEAIQEARKRGMRCIPAVEIDCTYQGVNLHVLGYGIDHHAAIFQQLEENVERQEQILGIKKLERTNALGFSLCREQLDAICDNGVYTGELFAEVLLNDPRYREHPLLEPYRPGGARGDQPYVNFYWDYYAQGKPCETVISYPSLTQVLAIIHQQQGIAVLAHPGNNLKGNYALLEEMIAIGIDGIECFSSYHKKAETDFFYEQAVLHHLAVTGGSDFHGKTKPAISLGDHNCTKEADVIEGLRKFHLI